MLKMDLGGIRGLMGLDMKESGFRVGLMGMAGLFMLMGTFMMVSGAKVGHKAKVFISTKMERVLKGIGKMIFSMVLGLKLGVMAHFIKEFIP